MWCELGMPLFPRIKSTYDPVVNAGAKSADLLKQFEDYSRGIIPLAPQSLLKLTVYGSARQGICFCGSEPWCACRMHVTFCERVSLHRAPDFSQVDMSRPDDPIWPVVAVGSELGNTDLRCASDSHSSMHHFIHDRHNMPCYMTHLRHCRWPHGKTSIMILWSWHASTNFKRVMYKHLHSRYINVTAHAPENLWHPVVDGHLRCWEAGNKLQHRSVTGTSARALSSAGCHMSHLSQSEWLSVNAECSSICWLDHRIIRWNQDDSHPHTYFADKECPDSPCGCLGYQSPLEPIHQRFLDQGHQIMVVTNDYSDTWFPRFEMTMFGWVMAVMVICSGMSISAWLFHSYFSCIQHFLALMGTTGSLGVSLAQLKTEELGEKQHVAQVTRRMNFANLRRWTSAPEPVKTWYDCLDLKFRTDEVLI